MDKFSTLAGAEPLMQGVAAEQRNQLEKAKSLASKNLKSPEEVDKAAGGFEALLLHNMLKAMWETVDSAGLFGEDSNQAEIYRDMLNQAIADSVAEGEGIGVKEFVKKELLKMENESSKEGSSSGGKS